MNASVQQLHAVRRLGSPRQIIAVACSIRHATQVAALYREQGLRVEVLHSQLKTDERDRIEATLRSGVTDVVVQVNILGEGYDLADAFRCSGLSALPQPFSLCAVRRTHSETCTAGHTLFFGKSRVSRLACGAQR